MRRRLVGDDVDRRIAVEQRREDVRGIADKADRQRPLGISRLDRQRERLVDVGGLGVEVAVGDAPVDAALVAVDADRNALVHGHRERLGATHAADACGERDRPGQGAAELLLRNRAERLVCALQDALRADVDPRACGHLAVHRQPRRLQLAELLPIRPVTNEIRVRDQYARRPDVCPEDADRLSGLDQQGLVVLEIAQRAHDRVERGPAARRPAGAAVDDEILGVLGDLGIEVVHQHAQRGFLLPTLAGQRRAARGADRVRLGYRSHGFSTPDHRPLLPDRGTH